MNQSSDPVQPLNAFAEEYLTLLREREEVPTAFEAERAGPWKIVKTAEGFGLFRLWESPEKGFVRIPTKPATHSDVKAATHSEAKAATLPELAASRAHGGSKWPP